MRAAIIDDLEPCRAGLRECVHRYFDEHYAGETPVVQEFCSGLGGYEAAARWTTATRYGFMLVFLALAFLLIKDSFPKLCLHGCCF